MTLGKKQSLVHEDFVKVWNLIPQIVPKLVYVYERSKTAAAIKKRCAGKRVAFGWSGGKDSIALSAVCREAGITKCVFGMTNHLEYPAWLQWVTDNMPEDLTVIKNSWDLNWLAANQDMLFPQSADVAGKWFKGIQHAAQAKYFADEQLDMILLGRRRIDGNFVGRDGESIYESRGVVRFSPIAEWSHELTLASMYWEGFASKMPPFYNWPRGYRCGTHAWPARQWCKGIADGWREVHIIDPSIVEAAAEKIASAKQYLESL
jgi:hypothetical protein